MKRALRFRERGSALVAVYDSLLFLMVVILVSAGMFISVPTTVGEGGEFSDPAYQRVCDDQLIMVEALSTNDSLPTPPIEWSNGTDEDVQSLANITDPGEAGTVRWLLESYCNLTWRNGDGQGVYDGQWNTSPVLPLVDAFFRASQLNGTEHAWLFLYQGEVVLFGSSSSDQVEDLPEDRWASSSDYSVTDQSGATQTIRYSAELRYFLWVP